MLISMLQPRAGALDELLLSVIDCYLYDDGCILVYGKKRPVCAEVSTCTTIGAKKHHQSFRLLVVQLLLILSIAPHVIPRPVV